MDLVRTEAPVATPVDLATVKDHLRISNTRSDAWLTALIDAATAALDGRAGLLRRALVTQTWRLTLCEWPGCRYLELPLPPLQSVSSVQYIDPAGTLQTFDPSDYFVVSNEFVGRIELRHEASWPSLAAPRPDAVQVTFVAGYGDAAAVPAPIRQALLLMIGELYADRGDGESHGLSPAADRLLAPYKVREFV